MSELAKQFHETYERLAPSFGYETRKDSAVPWENVPEKNKLLMRAVCAEVLSALQSRLDASDNRREQLRMERNAWREAAMVGGVYPNDTDVSTPAKWQTAQGYAVAALAEERDALQSRLDAAETERDEASAAACRLTEDFITAEAKRIEQKQKAHALRTENAELKQRCAEADEKLSRAHKEMAEFSAIYREACGHAGMKPDDDYFSLPQFVRAMQQRCAKLEGAVRWLRSRWETCEPMVTTDVIAAALAPDSGADAANPWQPIDTAPKRGEVLLVVEVRAGVSGKMLVGHYMQGGYCIEDHPAIDEGWYFWNGSMFDKASKPTHWMPLPPVPDSGAAVTYKHNPAHPIGTCGECGKEMLYNVPRLGPNGGYVHKATGKFECDNSGAGTKEEQP